jgi:hypothetical protein
MYKWVAIAVLCVMSVACDDEPRVGGEEGYDVVIGYRTDAGVSEDAGTDAGEESQAALWLCGPDAGRECDLYGGE